MLRKNNLKNFFLGFVFLLLNVFSFAEIPHSYVTENPKKEVQEVETFKQRNKTEMNLSITKTYSDNINALLIDNEFQIILPTEKIINKLKFKNDKNLNLKVEFIGGEEECYKITGKLQNSNNLDNLKILGYNNDKLHKSFKIENKIKVPRKAKKMSMFKIINNGREEFIYDSGIFMHKDNVYQRGEYTGTIMVDHLEIYLHVRSWTGEEYPSHNGMGDSSQSSIFIDLYDENWRLIETKEVYLWSFTSGDNRPFTKRNNEDVNINGHEGGWKGGYYPITDEVKYKFDKPYNYKIRYQYKPGQFIAHCYGGRQAQNVVRFFKMNTSAWLEYLRGETTLTFAEYYPVNEFVEFNASDSIQNSQTILLTNKVKDVTLDTSSGKAPINMEQNDKLIVDGHEVVIGAGGNIGPQKLTIGNLKYTYEVKNGKFRIALNEWGVLEPNRIIPIEILRKNSNDSYMTMSKHNFIIKAPRKVSGTSGVKLNQDYNLGEFIRFNGISLQGAGALGLENPIPLGVSLTSTAGQGIPFMKEGDILEISDDLTRAVKTFTVGTNGNLAKQQVSLKSGDIIVYTEAGKLRVSAINWVLNKPIKMNLGLIKGTNRVMDHSLEIQVPDAPFKVTKKGILDFGNVSSGTKRTAETDIGIEMMISDVEIVDFKLKDPNPTMENLTTGDTLAVDKIEYLVIKKDDKKYDIRLKGNLTIPEATKSGTYTGSTTMQLRLR